MFKIGNFYYPDGGGAFWENLLVATIGAFIGFGGALLIFWISIKKNRNEEKTKKEVYLLNRVDFLVLLIEGVIKSSKVQIANYVKQGNQIIENPYEISMLTVPASNQIKRLQNIDSQDLYQGLRYLFENGESTTDIYNQFFYQVDFLEKSLEQLFLANINNIKSIADDQETMRLAVGRLYSDFPRYFKDQKLKRFLLTQLEVFNKYIDTGKLDIRDFHEKFLIPLFNQVKMTETEDYENLTNLLAAIRNATTIIEHFKDNNLNYAKTDALAIENDLKECLERLEKYNSEIKDELSQAQFK